MKLHVPARIAAAAALTLSLTGCAFAATPVTSQQYSASDGVRVELEDVTGLNLLLISTGESEPAALIGSFDNAGSEAVDVTVVVGDGTTEFEVPAMSSVALGLEDDQEPVVGTASTDPGLIGSITVETAGSGTVTVDVPVLDGTLEEYASTLEALESAG